MQNSNEILGGYNPIEWKAVRGIFVDEYCVTKDSFIFSFNNNDKIENYVLSRVVDEDYAVYNYYNFGPSFGKVTLVYGDILEMSVFVTNLLMKNRLEKII